MLKDQDGPESDIGSLVEQERRMKREEIIKGLYYIKIGNVLEIAKCTK